MKYILYTTLFLSLLSFDAYASGVADEVPENPTALPFTAVVTDPVSLAKGGTNLTQTSSVSSAVFGNPASVPFSSLKGDFSAGYSLWEPSGSRSDIMTVAGAGCIKGKVGIAAGFSYGLNQPYEVYDESGNPDGSFRPSDMRLGVGLSWRFVKFLSLGVNFGYARSTLAPGASYGAFTSDIFLMSSFSGVRLSAGVSRIGSKVKASYGSNLYSLPAAASLGLGYGKVFGQKHGIDICADASLYFTKEFSASAGAEYSFDGKLFVRAGYRYGGQTVVPSYASVGLGGCLAGVRIDIAYLIAGKDSPMANTLACSLSYSF